MKGVPKTLTSIKEIQDQIYKLIPADDLRRMSGEEIVGQIALRIYDKEFACLREEVESIPEALWDILLLIDLDTELAMNGIRGFLENSNGRHLDKTIEALERIRSRNDLNVMKNIKHILAEYGVRTDKLRANVNLLAEYEVANPTKTHGASIQQVLERVEKEAEHLYLYRGDENLFDLLFTYVEANQTKLIEEIGAMTDLQV